MFKLRVLREIYSKQYYLKIREIKILSKLLRMKIGLCSQEAVNHRRIMMNLQWDLDHLLQQITFRERIVDFFLVDGMSS